jgi:hypothetical protein
LDHSFSDARHHLSPIPRGGLIRVKFSERLSTSFANAAIWPCRARPGPVFFKVSGFAEFQVAAL